MKGLVAIIVAVILAVGLWMAVSTNADSNEQIQDSKVAAQAAQTKAASDAAGAKELVRLLGQH